MLSVVTGHEPSGSEEVEYVKSLRHMKGHMKGQAQDSLRLAEMNA